MLFARVRITGRAVALPKPALASAGDADDDQHDRQQRQFDKRGDLNRIVEHDGPPPRGPLILRPVSACCTRACPHSTATRTPDTCLAAYDRIRDKLVLVGLTGAGVTDMRSSAQGERVPVTETIFEGRFLRRPAWLKWTESAFIILFGLLIIWYVPRRPSRFAEFMRARPRSSSFCPQSWAAS